MGKWERWAPLSGVIAVVFWVVGVILVSTNAKDGKGPKVLAGYVHHSNGILLGAMLWSLGVILFIWFLGSLRARLLALEGPAGRLTAIAYGGGIAAATVAILIPGGDVAGALNKDDLDPSSAAALHHLTDAFFVGAEYLLPVLFFACAVAAFRFGALPKWLAWFSVLIGIVLLIGPIGWAALMFATPIWVVTVSIWLYQTAEKPARIGAPATETA